MCRGIRWVDSVLHRIMSNNDDPVMSDDGDNKPYRPWKTPASLLQEMALKRGIVPGFNTIIDDKEPHESLYFVQCVVGEVRANGIARTKKAAKQAAAKEVLLKLLSTPQGLFEWQIPNVPMEEAITYVQGLMPELNGVVVRSEDLSEVRSSGSCEETQPGGIIMKTQSSVNYIGQLFDWTKRLKLPPAIYDECASGPAHSRDFTATCKVGNLETQATSKVKKTARHQASELMIEKLRNLPIDQLASLQLEDSANEADSSRDDTLLADNLQSGSVNTLPEAQGTCSNADQWGSIVGGQFSFSAAPRVALKCSPLCVRFDEGSSDPFLLNAQETSEKHCERLSAIAAINNWNDPVYQILTNSVKQPNKSGDNSQSVACLVTISGVAELDHELVSLGIGSAASRNAQQVAARNMLQMFSRLVCKYPSPFDDSDFNIMPLD